MKFIITLRLFEFSYSQTIRKKISEIVDKLSINIDTYVKKQNYGNGIFTYEIILYVIDMPEEYQHLYRDFKPKFTEHKLLTNKHTLEKYEINKYFNYSIKIKGELFNKFIEATPKNGTRILALEILKSFSNIDSLPKNVKDFDKEKFKTDMYEFFKKKNLA